MTITRNGAEGGTDGTTVTTGNSGGASGTAWDTVTLNGGDIEYDNAQKSHDSLAYLVQPVISTQCELRRNISSSTAAMISFYVRTPASPFTAESCIAQIRHATAAAGFVKLTTDGKFRVQEHGGATVYTSAAYTTSTWYRCELRLSMGSTTGNGTLEFAYYTLASPATAVASYSSSARNTGVTGTDTSYTNVRYGRCSSATTDVTTLWMDSLQELTGADATALNVDWPAAIPPATASGGPLVWTGSDWE